VLIRLGDQPIGGADGEALVESDEAITIDVVDEHQADNADCGVDRHAVRIQIDAQAGRTIDGSVAARIGCVFRSIDRSAVRDE
jgi:hypothetical protein